VKRVEGGQARGSGTAAEREGGQNVEFLVRPEEEFYILPGKRGICRIEAGRGAFRSTFCPESGENQEFFAGGGEEFYIFPGSSRLATRFEPFGDPDRLTLAPTTGSPRSAQRVTSTHATASRSLATTSSAGWGRRAA